MSQPLVSTITPCFRMQKYLPAFLEWLPRQTMFDRMEVVLDHNEPTDEEVSQVRAFQAKHPGRIKHIIVPKVEPIGASMNRCIRQAVGEYVTIWNVDDLRTDDSIQQQYELLTKSPEHGIAYGDYQVVRSFTATVGEPVVHAGYPDSELTRSMIIGPFFMFRKSLCDKAGMFDEQLRSGADFDLAIRLAMHTKAVRVAGQLGYYLNEGLGASTRPNSLQPIEQTVIELRYGIFDKLDYSYVPQTVRYNVPNMLVEGKWLPVSDYVPNYVELIKQRQQDWVLTGLKKFCVRWPRRHRLQGTFKAIRAARQRLGLLPKGGS